MKGFKDSDGKFHPTENNNGKRTPSGKSIIPTGMRMMREKNIATNHVLDPEAILQSADGTSLVNYHGSPRYSEKRLKGSLISELQNDYNYNLRTIEALRGQQRVMEKNKEEYDKVGLEHDVKIAEGKNEQIKKELESREKRMARDIKFNNGDKIIFNGKHTVLNTKLPEDRSGKASCVSFSNQPQDEEITYVVSKSDTDGHLFYHWENHKGQTICWTGSEAGFAQSDLARRTRKFAFRTDYRDGLQYNLDPSEFGVEKQ